MSNSTDRNNGTDWAEKIGKPAYEAIAEMVAALECDYERLEELREEREAWAGENTDDAEELKELEEAAGECKDREDAEERIYEDPLSLEVRSDWTTPGEEMTPGEFCLLLGTGGPAVRIVGDLDEHGEPCRARLEVQDWFKPWTEYVPADGDTLLTYCRCFSFAS